MAWILGFLMFVFLFIVWLLVSGLELNVDTRKPWAELRWKTIGQVRVWHDQEWLIRFRILFFSKTMPITDLKRSEGKAKKIKAETNTSKPSRLNNIPGRVIDVIKSFEVKQCTLAVDTGDHTRNARLYPLNYVPFTRGHLFVNFIGENYFVLKIRNRPWRILYSFFRRSFV